MKGNQSPHLLSAAYITLGCKVNQYETEQIRCSLEANGFMTVGQNEPADVYIINTCSVTHTADSKSRSAIRKAIRANPEALVVITGCYSQLEPLAASAIDGVDMIVSNEDKESICDYVTARLGIDRKYLSPSHQKITRRIRTRAVVKVQDGCDNYCSYCIIPFARSKMVSRPVEEVTDEVRSLVDAGFQEIVFTGIRLGSYFWQNNTIADLLHRCAAIDGIGRIRLSSIEPWEITDDLLAAMNSPKVCRHLHVPLQSGDDATLASMNRRYSSRQYLDTLDNIRNRLSGIGITTDVIVGFPGEDQKAFETSMQTVKMAAFARLHVFRFSPRDRTAAISMPNQVSSQEKQRRAEIMETLGQEQQLAFASLWIGRILPVLLESETASAGVYRGYTDNYIEVNVASSQHWKNRIVNVKILDIIDNRVVQGEMVNDHI